MVYFQRLFLLVVLAFCSSASAVVPVANEYKVSNSYGDKAGWFSSAEAACAGAVAQYPGGVMIWANGNCGVKSGGYEFGWGISQRVACPVNSVLVPGTSTCTCNSGFEEKTANA